MPPCHAAHAMAWAASMLTSSAPPARLISLRSTTCEGYAAVASLPIAAVTRPTLKRLLRQPPFARTPVTAACDHVVSNTTSARSRARPLWRRADQRLLLGELQVRRAAASAAHSQVSGWAAASSTAPHTCAPPLPPSRCPWARRGARGAIAKHVKSACGTRHCRTTRCCSSGIAASTRPLCRPPASRNNTSCPPSFPCESFSCEAARLDGEVLF